jgi:uncharacterized protein
MKAKPARPFLMAAPSPLHRRRNVTTFVVMKFEWDPVKNTLNFKKHGILFEEACLVFDGPVLTGPDNRRDYGEERQISIGSIQQLIVVVVVHTDRDGSIRIISARLASRKERKLYHEHVGRET